MVFTIERALCCSIEYKYIDALLERCSPLVQMDLALLVIITRLEKVPSIPVLSDMLQYQEIDIEFSLKNLVSIGFLSLTDIKLT